MKRWGWLLFLPFMFTKTPRGCQFSHDGKAKEFLDPEKCKRIEGIVPSLNLAYALGELEGQGKTPEEIADDLAQSTAKSIDLLSEVR